MIRCCLWQRFHVQVGTFQHPLQDGWGITTQGKLLVMSDGSSRLTWVDPAQGFTAVKSVVVKDGTRSIGYLNEVGMGATDRLFNMVPLFLAPAHRQLESKLYQLGLQGVVLRHQSDMITCGPQWTV